MNVFSLLVSSHSDISGRAKKEAKKQTRMMAVNLLYFIKCTIFNGESIFTDI